MAGFDFTRVFRLTQIMEQGDDDSKLEAIASLDPAEPLDIALLTRGAMETEQKVVRLAALERIASGRVALGEEIAAHLEADDDAEIRAAVQAIQRDATQPNPLETLVPQVEQLASQLGQHGDLFRQTVEPLRNIGAEDEKTQRLALNSLDTWSPTAQLVISQALSSEHLSVRLEALRKASQFEEIRVSDGQIQSFLDDPSIEVRNLAEVLVRQGQIGEPDFESLRQRASEQMYDNLENLANERTHSSSPHDEESSADDGRTEAEPTSPFEGLGGFDMSQIQDMMKNIDMNQVQDMMNNMDMSQIQNLMGNFDMNNMQDLMSNVDMSQVQNLMGNLDLS
ncbi:MAG: hypothetical protein KC561_10120, partial [Myxococcales bacterium]|nr:hypothetical protein [Myxococcales bacterium]